MLAFAMAAADDDWPRGRSPHSRRTELAFRAMWPGVSPYEVLAVLHA